MAGGGEQQVGGKRITAGGSHSKKGSSVEELKVMGKKGGANCMLKTTYAGSDWLIDWRSG